jgi:phage tail sheath protein FI
MRSVYAVCSAYCRRQRAFLLVDIPAEGTATPADMRQWMTTNDALRDDHAAVYFPVLEMPDRLNEFRNRTVGPSGTLAGVFARTDAARGVWKAPAGTEATLRGASLRVKITDLENGGLNPIGINTLRNFPVYGNVAWGARTLDGADQKASEWKYISVRRTALFIEESLFQGLKWVVFEPNDEPLWAQIRLNVGAFMHNLFRQAAFQGTTPKEAYFVKCDKETTTQTDVNLGLVNIVVGFAPLKPAEFVVIKLQQIAGPILT